jgi:CheY-like chemotaxis protein
MELQFSVRDTGIGISGDRMHRLFRAFSQADSSTARLYGGTGLGLAISQRLVEALGGQIWVESRVGEGSTFRFTIRCRIADPGRLPDQARDGEAGLPEAGLPSLPPLRILVAEDNVINQKVILLMLQRLGYSADVAADGEETLDALRRQRYDVILMDVQMPGMDGLEATRRIRSGWPAAEQPRIVAVTANALYEDREACLAAGMDDYLSKPVLLPNLRAALSRGPGAPTPATAAAAAVPAAPGSGEEEIFNPHYIDQLRQLEAATGRDLVAAIVDRFLAEAPLRLAELRSALAAEDSRNFAFIAHAFKGSSSQLGASRLAALCRELERRGGNAEWQGTAEIVTHLAGEIERVAPLLRAKAAELWKTVEQGSPVRTDD